MTSIGVYKDRFFNFSQYIGASLFVSVLQIVINPWIALNMSPEDYAVVGYYSSFSALLTPLINFFLINFFIQRYFRVSLEERVKIKATVIQLLVYLSFFLTIVSFLGLFIYHNYLNSGSEIPFSPYALLTLLAIPLTGLYSFKLAEYRLERRATKFSVLTISLGLLVVGANLLFVVVFKWGATGKMIAALTANVVMFTYVLAKERKCFSITIEKKLVLEIIGFCWPLAFAGMLAFFNSGIDKVLLERLGNVKELGIYSVGAQMAAYLSIFSNAVNSTFQPDIYECYAKKQRKKLGVYVLIIVGSITLAVLFFILFAPFLIKLLTAGRYVDSTPYARIIAISSITAAIYYSSSQITMAMGYTKLLLWVKIVASIIVVVTYFILIKHFGFVGAAWGTAISYIVYFVVNISFLRLFKHGEVLK